MWFTNASKHIGHLHLLNLLEELFLSFSTLVFYQLSLLIYIILNNIFGSLGVPHPPTSLTVTMMIVSILLSNPFWTSGITGVAQEQETEDSMVNSCCGSWPDPVKYNFKYLFCPLQARKIYWKYTFCLKNIFKVAYDAEKYIAIY